MVPFWAGCLGGTGVTVGFPTHPLPPCLLLIARLAFPLFLLLPYSISIDQLGRPAAAPASGGWRGGGGGWWFDVNDICRASAGVALLVVSAVSGVEELLSSTPSPSPLLGDLWVQLVQLQGIAKAVKFQFHHHQDSIPFLLFHSDHYLWPIHWFIQDPALAQMSQMVCDVFIPLMDVLYYLPKPSLPLPPCLCVLFSCIYTKKPTYHLPH